MSSESLQLNHETEKCSILLYCKVQSATVTNYLQEHSALRVTLEGLVPVCISVPLIGRIPEGGRIRLAHGSRRQSRWIADFPRSRPGSPTEISHLTITQPPPQRPCSDSDPRKSSQLTSFVTQLDLDDEIRIFVQREVFCIPIHHQTHNC